MYRDQTSKRRINPRQTANILSFISFFYTIKLYIQGYTKGLETEDIYEVLPEFCSKNLADNLEKNWQKEKREKLKPSILRVLWQSYGKAFIFLGLLQFVHTMIMTIWSPRALSKLISYFTIGQTEISKQDAVFYAVSVIVLHFVNVFIKHNLRLFKQFLGMRAKAAVSCLLYRKSLKLSSQSLSDVTAGKIVTIMSKDLDFFEAIVIDGNNVWIAFIQTCLICYLIYNKIGIAAVPGIAVYLIIMPVQVILGKLGYNLRLQCSKKTDDRLDLIREILSAIRIIKMYTWEKFFETKVDSVRKTELKKLHRIFYTKVGITILGTVCSKVAFFIFLMTYVWMGHNVTAEIAYYILSCSNDLESSLTSDIPLGLGYFAEFCATLKRVESVLGAQELSQSQPTEKKIQKIEIVFKNVTVKIRESTVLEIQNLTLDGNLNVVFGHTGSGKTTFLKTILQESQVTGKLDINGSISYASQEPWLFPSTIRNNILFGEKYNKERYEEVLRACCLDHDLKILSEGDGTLVGDRGLNLSRGQQARINLARAVYKDSDIYLLDDCLAALDGQVSDTIFKKCIHKFLRTKLRIFVTNNLDYLNTADKIIEIKRQSVKFLGKDQSKLLNFEKKLNGQVENNYKINEEMYSNKQLYAEKKKSGMVPLKCYRKYLKFGGGFVVFGLIFALFIAAQSTSSISEKILSQWVTLGQNLSDYNNGTSSVENKNLEEERKYKIRLYTVITLSSLILSLIRSFSFFYFTRRICINIHEAVVRNVLNSTMKFFDSHFIGNILTRFTKDFLTVDETLPYVTMNCLWMLFSASGGVILMTSVNYIFFVQSLLLLLISCVIKQFCQPTGRNLERLHVMARSPINGHLNSTLEGLTTIRACKAEKIVIEEFDRHQDLFNSVYCMVVTNFTSVAFFISLACQIFICFTILQFLVFNLDVVVGDVGLVISQSMVITGIISSAIVCVADFENLMVSTERVLEFTELEEEDKSGSILIGWPKSGVVSFDDVSLSYDNTEKEMLSDISFDINSKEKLGIVGRTGAGKSSIISALFRLYETRGKITIDGVNIREVCLNWLRCNISVIPQEPYLFSGTVRENLDPLKQKQDEEIWKVLEELELKNIIDDLNMRLDKGSSFSAGQKQLLCLARAVLRKNKIVVLDEATANVDKETDALMRETVRKHFRECTVIIIAHRLSSVMSCQKVLVLNNGRISEFDEPDKLMQNKSSFFHSVIK